MWFYVKMEVKMIIKKIGDNTISLDSTSWLMDYAKYTCHEEVEVSVWSLEKKKKKKKNTFLKHASAVPTR